MADTQFIRTLGLIVVAAAVMVLVGRRFGVPSIVSSMLAGFLLVPVMGLVEADAVGGDGAGSLALVTEVGIVLLLFLVGLELSLEEIREVGAVAVVAAVGQSLVMAVLVLMLSLWMGMGTAAAIIMAIAMGFSSTVVVVKQLEARGELDQAFGRISVGILLVQDLIVVIVLTVLAGLSGAAGMTGVGGEDPEAGGLGPLAIGLSLLRAFGLMGALLAATLLCARFVLPPIFGRIDRSPAAAMVAALAWCFVLVEAAALMGLSVEIGAFLAGIGLGGLPHRNDLRRRVKPLMGFFIAVFFASLGSRIDLDDLSARWPLAVGLTLLVLLVKPPVFRLLAGLMGAGRRTSVDVAVTLAQISEFSLILGAAAISVPGLLEPEDVAAIGMLGPVALVTIIVSVVAMSRRESIHRRLGTPPADPETTTGARHDPPPAGHVVVVGMNPLGRALVHGLAARGVEVVAVDTDARKLAGLPARRVLGDVEHAEAREEAAIPAATLVVCALRIESANRMLALRCRELGVPVVLHAFDRSMRAEFERLGPAALIDSKAGADTEVDAMLVAAGIPGPRSGEAAAC